MRLTKKFHKYLLYIFTLVLAILGIILIGYGFWLLDSMEAVDIDHGENLAGTLIIVLGFVIFVMSIYGSLANCNESKRMLIVYAVVLIVLLVIQIVLISLSYLAAKGGLPNDLQNGFDELWDPQKDEYNGTLSKYEQWLHCCGRNSAEDYLLLDKIPPSSCCRDNDCSKILNVYIDGCEKKFTEYVEVKSSDFNRISWIVIVIEFFGSVIACVLIEIIRNERDRVRLYS